MAAFPTFGTFRHSIACFRMLIVLFVHLYYNIDNKKLKHRRGDPVFSSFFVSILFDFS